MIETWKPVVGWSGLYEVSDHGRVKSLGREFTDSLGRIRKFPECMLKGGIDRNGYRTVTLCANGRQRTYRAHYLVALAFIGPRPEGLEICHGDGHPLNNRPSNLRYDTRANNAADMKEHGTSPKGIRNGAAVLNEAQVRLARHLKGKGCNAVLAEAWGCNERTLRNIQHGRNWRHLK